MAYFQIENLSKNFGETAVLKDINLSVEKGEVISIIGSSGSGKTTLLRIINFLEGATSGKMYLDGEKLIDCDNTQNTKKQKKESEIILRQKRLNFGLVFQSFNLFPQYTVLKNITLSPNLMLKERFAQFKRQHKDKILRAEFLEKEKAQIERDAQELLIKTGLEDKKNSYPFELSGGQCQRVAIARALILKPKILCFDEPTSALDPELTGEVLKVIRSLKYDNHTMIIVTHEMGFAKNLSDRVVFMADGVILEEGTPQEIFATPKTEKLKTFLSNVSDKENI